MERARHTRSPATAATGFQSGSKAGLHQGTETATIVPRMTGRMPQCPSATPFRQARRTVDAATAEGADVHQCVASRPPCTLGSPPYDGARMEAATILSPGSPTTVPRASVVGGTSRQRTVGTLGERLMIQHGLPTMAFTLSPSTASGRPIPRGGQWMVPRGMPVGRCLQHYSALTTICSGNEWPATLLTVVRQPSPCPGVITSSRFGASLMELWTCLMPAGP
jgi:hypothetical protein